MYRVAATWKEEAERIVRDLDARWQMQGANTTISIGTDGTQYWLAFHRMDPERSLAHTSGVCAESWRELTAYVKGFSGAVHLHEYEEVAPKL